MLEFQYIQRGLFPRQLRAKTVNDCKSLKIWSQIHGCPCYRTVFENLTTFT